MSRRAILLLFAGGIIIFTIVLLRSRLSDAPVEAPEPAPVQAVVHIVIAKRDLAVGSFVQGVQDLDWGLPPDKGSVANSPDASSPANTAGVPVTPSENYLYEGSVKLTDFNGAVVRRSMHAGDPIPQSALMKSGEGGFMSAVLEPGMRAVSIGVTPTSGNAGFVSPGDRIDLIVTHRIKNIQGSGGNDDIVASETFVRNVRVVAVDQMLDNPDNKAILAKTVTVEVTPRQAEEVAVAGDLGKISVALRSLTSQDPKAAAKPEEDEQTRFDAAMELKDAYDDWQQKREGSDPASNESGFTRDSDISALLLSHKSNAVPRVRVIHGDKLENIDFDQDKK